MCLLISMILYLLHIVSVHYFRCFALFKTAHDLTQTPEAVKLATTLTLEEFDRDNVVYLELRSTPRANSNMTKEQYIQSIVDGIM